MKKEEIQEKIAKINEQLRWLNIEKNRLTNELRKAEGKPHKPDGMTSRALKFLNDNGISPEYHNIHVWMDFIPKGYENDRHTENVVFRRAATIWLIKHYSQHEVAKMVGYKRNTVPHHIKMFNEEMETKALFPKSATPTLDLIKIIKNRQNENTSRMA